ncbi:MAG: HoxN/HupN/NixA family nickel/cobalt transporter [Pseudomonadota bacterium]|nr:HoxN/HupN/NixA family nickel/cobalt transporter [Pseudomonadota bacterium]
MRGFLSRLWNASDSKLRGRLIALYGALAAANVGVWVWAFFALRDNAVLFGSAFLAYSFGLRHAVDADHIAAIDNSTRKLMQQGGRPVGVGLFFSLGHAAAVVLLSLAVGFAAAKANAEVEGLKAWGGLVSAGASALFLFLLAAFNIVVLISVWRTFQAVKRGEPFSDDDFDILLNSRGFLARLFRPLFALVTKSWHLFPIGFLFGLGFDTATEVALFGISATQAANGASLATLFVLPALFTAAMTLVDTSDGVLMLGAYGWAFMKPIRKLYYNITITAVSVLIAVLIGGIETLGLIGDQFELAGPFWDIVGALNDNFGVLGYLIIGVFALSWLASVLIYRAKGYDLLDVTPAP